MKGPKKVTEFTLVWTTPMYHHFPVSWSKILLKSSCNLLSSVEESSKLKEVVLTSYTIKKLFWNRKTKVWSLSSLPVSLRLSSKFWKFPVDLNGLKKWPRRKSQETKTRPFWSGDVKSGPSRKVQRIWPSHHSRKMSTFGDNFGVSSKRQTFCCKLSMQGTLISFTPQISRNTSTNSVKLVKTKNSC